MLPLVQVLRHWHVVLGLTEVVPCTGQCLDCQAGSYFYCVEVPVSSMTYRVAVVSCQEQKVEWDAPDDLLVGHSPMTYRVALAPAMVPVVVQVLDWSFRYVDVRVGRLVRVPVVIEALLVLQYQRTKRSRRRRRPMMRSGRWPLARVCVQHLVRQR